MKPSELASSDDLDDFWMDNAEYFDDLEILIDEIFSEQEQHSDFMKNVVDIVWRYKELRR